jgi:hypothetical protein
MVHFGLYKNRSVLAFRRKCKYLCIPIRALSVLYIGKRSVRMFVVCVCVYACVYEYVVIAYCIYGVHLVVAPVGELLVKGDPIARRECTM